VDIVKSTIHVKKGDTVVVLSGKDKGKKGKILQVLPQAQKVIVENVNMIKKHTKPNPNMNNQGGIIEKEAAIHSSNVMIVCNRCNKPTRIGGKRLDDKTNARVCKQCGELLDK
jgi:large subunit ribosomal protein L24